jgi:hypothetical protein
LRDGICLRFRCLERGRPEEQYETEAAEPLIAAHSPFLNSGRIHFFIVYLFAENSD